MNKYITCVDVETTGLDKRNDYIIQLALLKFDKATYEEVARYSWYIIPQHKWCISKGAQDVHGLSEEFIKENGTTIREIVAFILFSDSTFLTFTSVICIKTHVLSNSSNECWYFTQLIL